MLFSSMTFIYIFLPFVCLLYFLCKPSFRNHILLFASIAFYGWGEPKYLAIMILTILINYFGAIVLDKFRNFKKPILIFSILLDLSFLVYFKYFDFLITNLNSLFRTNFDLLNVMLPIGISFYTFQAMSYLIDVYREDVKVQKNIYNLSLYITLFPQLVAGPIVKYHDIESQIKERKVTAENLIYGIKRFIIGLSKKVLIANTMGAVADKVFSQQVMIFDTATAWLGAICYTFQIYYDFSGYSDMAIGLGKIFGFHFLENFNYPYISNSITAFWRRWHISLSTWFKEYLYIPLGGNRKGKGRKCLNIFVVFLTTGIWHGASWTFIFWGLWHGFFNILEQLTDWHKDKKNIFLKIAQHIYTILVIVCGWVLFRADNLSHAFNYVKNMFGLVQDQRIGYMFAYYVGNFDIVILIVATIFSIPICKNILLVKNDTKKHKIFNAVLNVVLFALFLFSTASIALSTYNPFIYFRF